MPVAPKKPENASSADAVYPEPEVMEAEENAASEVQEPSEIAPEKPRQIGPTSLPARLKPVLTREGRKDSRL
jgi:hypothetical protein